MPLPQTRERLFRPRPVVRQQLVIDQHAILLVIAARHFQHAPQRRGGGRPMVVDLGDVQQRQLRFKIVRIAPCRLDQQRLRIGQPVRAFVLRRNEHRRNARADLQRRGRGDLLLLLVAGRLVDTRQPQLREKIVRVALQPAPCSHGIAASGRPASTYIRPASRQIAFANSETIIAFAKNLWAAGKSPWRSALVSLGAKFRGGRRERPFEHFPGEPANQIERPVVARADRRRTQTRVVHC